jgi:hypothetical protein
MPIKTHRKRDIALSQLETALRLHDDLAHDYAVINLAGAAERILGGMLADQSVSGRFPRIKRSSRRLQRWMRRVARRSSGRRRAITAALRAVEDHRPGDPPVVEFDAREHGAELLHRAIVHFWALERIATPSMVAFATARSTS